MQTQRKRPVQGINFALEMRKQHLRMWADLLTLHKADPTIKVNQSD